MIILAFLLSDFTNVGKNFTLIVLALPAGILLRGLLLRPRYILWKKTRFVSWVKKNLLPHTTLRQLEDRAAKNDPSLTKDALNWIAQQLIISDNSHHRLLLILREVSKYSTTGSFSPDDFEGPWWALPLPGLPIHAKNTGRKTISR